MAAAAARNGLVPCTGSVSRVERFMDFASAEGLEISGVIHGMGDIGFRDTAGGNSVASMTGSADSLSEFPAGLASGTPSREIGTVRAPGNTEAGV